MILIPVPMQHVEDLSPIWSPFTRKIAEAGEISFAELEDDIRAGTTHVLLAWDGEKAHAMAGAQIERGGDDGHRVCHIRWCTGQDRELWFDLVDQIEAWASEHMDCRRSRITCRPGWTPALKGKGYRETHRVLERPINVR